MITSRLDLLYVHLNNKIKLKDEKCHYIYNARVIVSPHIVVEIMVSSRLSSWEYYDYAYYVNESLCILCHELHRWRNG